MATSIDGKPIVWPHEAVQAMKFQLNRDTVLKARTALLAEADRLDRGLNAGGSDYKVGLCGGDPVSRDAAAAFTERIEALIDGCRAYNRALRAAAHTLDETARYYGYTDEEIAASFVPQQ